MKNNVEIGVVGQVNYENVPELMFTYYVDYEPVGYFNVDGDGTMSSSIYDDKYEKLIHKDASQILGIEVKNSEDLLSKSLSKKNSAWDRARAFIEKKGLVIDYSGEIYDEQDDSYTITTTRR